MAKSIQAVQEEIEALRKRVEQQYPSSDSEVEGVEALPLADLLPLFHARDAAEGKVAAIGKVNPRPAGGLNSLIQTAKRQIARSLGWFVRDQVDFNYASVRALTEAMDALNAVNRSLVAASVRLNRVESAAAEISQVREEADARLRQATDSLSSQIHAQSSHLHDEITREVDTVVASASLREATLQRMVTDLEQELERVKLRLDEQAADAQRRAGERDREDIRLLRALADVQNAFMQRIALLDADLKQTLERRAQQAEVSSQAAVQTLVAEGRAELEHKIHEELVLLRQRVGAVLARQGAQVDVEAAAQTAAAAIAPPQAFFDSVRFSERFRGSAASVREKLRVHVDTFQKQTPVFDLGCGSGEFLGLLAEAGIEAVGVDSNTELVLTARGAGYQVQALDLFDFLEAQPESSAGGIFSAHVIEHMSPYDLSRLIALAWRVLRPGGVLVFETPNPACLAIFATYFYLDPTHVRPVPSELASYLLEEQGFQQIQVAGLHPADLEFDGLKPIPESFRQQFFGFLDYAVTARKPS